MRTAIVTGASSGIGLEIARELAAQKIRLVLVARNQKALQDLATELKEKNDIEVLVLTVDLAKPNSPSLIFQELQSRNWSVDILVNNAGFGDHGPFVDSEWKNQAAILQVNIVALTELTHLFLPAMRDRKAGHILNVASTASFQAGPWMSVYYASKAFVLSFSEAIAEEMSSSGVFVTSLCPGPTESNFMKVAGVGKIELPGILKIPTSKEVAIFGVRAMEKGQVIAVQGLLNRIMVVVGKILPRSVSRKAVKKFQEVR